VGHTETATDIIMERVHEDIGDKTYDMGFCLWKVILRSGRYFLLFSHEALLTWRTGAMA